MEDSGRLLLVVDVHERYVEGCESTKRDFVTSFAMNGDGRLLGPGGVFYGPFLFLWRKRSCFRGLEEKGGGLCVLRKRQVMTESKENALPTGKRRSWRRMKTT